MTYGRRCVGSSSSSSSSSSSRKRRRRGHRFLLYSLLVAAGAATQAAREEEEFSSSKGYDDIDFRPCSSSNGEDNGSLQVNTLYFVEESCDGVQDPEVSKESGDLVTIHIFATASTPGQAINTSSMQIFLDVTLDGLGLKKSVDPSALCPFVSMNGTGAEIETCIFNDTIHIAYEYIEDLQSGIYDYKIVVNNRDILSTGDCTGPEERSGDGSGDVFCVRFDRTIVNGYALQLLSAAFAFAIAAAASWTLAQAFPLLRMPIITGYLIIGACCGPSGTNLITPFYVDLLSSQINAFALAFIAFAAGEEIFLPSLQSIMRNICRQLLSISATTFVAVTITFHILLSYGDSTFGTGSDDDDPKTEWAKSFAGRLAISMLMASIMAARSPASAVAIVKEIGARGKGTKLMLGVTVLSDVVVLLLFSVVYAIATVLCHARGANGEETSFDALSVLVLLSQFVLTIAMGYVVGRLLDCVLWIPIRRFRVPYNPVACFRKTGKGLVRCFGFDPWGPSGAVSKGKDYDFVAPSKGSEGDAVVVDDDDDEGVFTLYRSYVKGPVILCIGWGTFVFTEWLAKRSADWFGGRQMRIESLLVCMIAACYVSHYSGPRRRHFFARILNKSAPYVFLPFFTLAGASLDIPKVVAGWAAAFIICGVRIASIAGGSLVVGAIERRFAQHNDDDDEVDVAKDGQVGTADMLEDPLIIKIGHGRGVSSKEEEEEEPKSCKHDGVGVVFDSKIVDDEMSANEGRAVQEYLWFTLLAQAGVSIGLALQVKDTFDWGDRFSNVVLSVIVLNQIVGPIMCKIGLQAIMAASPGISDGERDGDDDDDDNDDDDNDDDDGFEASSSVHRAGPSRRKRRFMHVESRGRSWEDHVEDEREKDGNDRHVTPKLKKFWSCPAETNMSDLARNRSPTTPPSKHVMKRLPSCSAYHSLLNATPTPNTRTRTPGKARRSVCVTPGFG